MKKYLIIVEKTETGYSAFSPDVPGFHERVFDISFGTKAAMPK